MAGISSPISSDCRALSRNNSFACRWSALATDVGPIIQPSADVICRFWRAVMCIGRILPKLSRADRHLASGIGPLVTSLTGSVGQPGPASGRSGQLRGPTAGIRANSRQSEGRGRAACSVVCRIARPLADLAVNPGGDCPDSAQPVDCSFSGLFASCGAQWRSTRSPRRKPDRKSQGQSQGKEVNRHREIAP